MGAVHENGNVPQFHRKTCRLCGNPPVNGERISATGLCFLCAERRHLEHNRQLAEHSGPWFDRWRGRSLAAFGVAVDIPPEPQ